MPKKKSNWDLIRNQKDTDTVKYRDVYEDQQLERGSIAEKQTMTGRLVLSGVASLLVAVLIWTIVSAVQMVTRKEGLDDDANPADDWVYVSEYYYDVNDPNKVLSVEEYNKWYKTYHDYDDQRSETDEAPEVPINDLAEFAASFYYQDGVYSKDYVDYSPSEYQQMVFDHEKEYNAKLEEYDLYYYRHTDPEYHEDDSESGGYKNIASHYKNVNNLSEVISEDAYNNLISDYEKNSGQLSDDVKSIPLKPINIQSMYEKDNFKYMTYDDYWHMMGLTDTSVSSVISKDSFDEFLTWCAENGYNIVNSPYSLDPISAPDASDTNAAQQYAAYQTFWAKLKEVFGAASPSQSYKDCWETLDKYCQEVHYDRETGQYLVGSTIICVPQSYINKLDGTVISVSEYDELVNKYNQDMESYQAAYYKHRETYHPDDIDGTKATFTMRPNLVKIVLSLLIPGILFGILVAIFKKNLTAQNLMSDTSDINQYHNDQHVALPEEIQKNYDWFPDVGAHSAVQVSSMISHMALSNKGLKNVTMAKRAKEDIKDEDGRIEYYKGEILLDDKGEPLTKSEPIIDTDFMEALFDASGAPKDKKIRHYYDPTKIPYNPGNENRDKLQDKQKPYDTVADLINRDWEFPLYEPQRPAGAYIVDTAPVNTMVLAITRAGKGQTVIEPTLDMWMREKRPNNMVVNDPKGELLVKNYVRATVRGLQVVQFNLINAMKTDIYNPLALAADAAREGDNTKCAMYVENIAEVFFPVNGSEDPFWPNAANNAFKRAAYGLIDYYLEEEKAMRRMAERTGLDVTVLEQRLDEMWGKVTLYNCYQLFVQLSSKKMKNPAVEFSNQAKAGKFNDLSDEEYKIQLEKVKEKSKLWEDKPEVDLLTLFFSATDALPRNSMRTLVGNANNALKAMGGSDKTISSVYGIAITAMSFFTDPTISTLTSGTPNQNVDLGSFSFPRRMGVRFNSDYIQKNHFVGQQAVWDAYEDDKFEKCLGKLFHHDDTVSREGWARYFFDGKFKNEVSYIKLEIRNPSTESLIRTFYFKFKKSYQTSLDGRVYVKDPVLEEKIVKNGILTEMRKFRDKNTGEYVYKEAKTTFEQEKILDIADNGEKTKVKTNAIISMMARYAEKPKMTFLVTPPHLMKYAKLILILIKQLVDMNFDKSYMTKSNQKPLYKTRYMLDELGNLQSEGHGIAGFETMLSIGLGQEQQFTLILQTLQQLKDVYGDSVDKIVQGNTSNIVFLKSTDDSMIETLSKMSGVRHRTYTDSKTITKDMQAILKMTQNEGKASYTMTTKEEPVISYNDMAFISERNSIVFRAGDSPIWNRNETILPMSWRLFMNTIKQPGKDYTLQTIPTLSTAMDFDVRKNQPNFMQMLETRMEQAYIASDAAKKYQEAYGYDDYQMSQLDPDNLSDDIMDLIYTTLHPDEIKEAMQNAATDESSAIADDDLEEMFDYMFGNQSRKNSKYHQESTDVINEFDLVSENTEQLKANAQEAANVQSDAQKRYAGNQLSRDDLVSRLGINHAYDSAIVRIYKKLRTEIESDEEYFTVRDRTYAKKYKQRSGNEEKEVTMNVIAHELCGKDGKVYIRNEQGEDHIKMINEAAKSGNSRVFAENDMSNEDANAIGSCVVTDDFLRFLVTFQGAWPFANGEFEKLMKAELIDGDSDSIES